MSTTELIEIAQECGAEVTSCHQILGALEMRITPAILQQFAQRIEAPHKQRISELEKDCEILQTNLDSALMQVKQLREALRKVSTNSLTCGCSAIADRVLEQTK